VELVHRKNPAKKLAPFPHSTCLLFLSLFLFLFSFSSLKMIP